MLLAATRKCNNYIQMNIGYKSGPKQYHLYTPRRKHMGRSIARGSKKTLIDQCYDDLETRKFMMKKVGRVLKGEMKIMSQVKTKSILRSGSYEDLKEFKWETLLEELTPALQRNIKGTIGMPQLVCVLPFFCSIGALE